MKRDCTGNSFKDVKDFYCYNFHGISYRDNDCRKPIFDNDNRNSRMFRGTKNVGNNERSRSSQKISRERISNDGERPN